MFMKKYIHLFLFLLSLNIAQAGILEDVWGPCPVELHSKTFQDFIENPDGAKRALTKLGWIEEQAPPLLAIYQAAYSDCFLEKTFDGFNFSYSEALRYTFLPFFRSEMKKGLPTYTELHILERFVESPDAILWLKELRD